MHSLLELDRIQLRRIEVAIAALDAQPAAYRQRRRNLLQALESERQELIRCNPAIRAACRLKAA